MFSCSGLTSDENSCLDCAIQMFCPITADLLESEPNSLALIKQLFDLQVSVCPGFAAPVTGLINQVLYKYLC